MESNANNINANNSPSVTVKHSLSTFNNINNNGNNSNNTTTSPSSSSNSTNSNGSSRIIPNGILKRPPRPPVNNNSSTLNSTLNSSPILSANSTPAHHRTVAVAKQTAKNEEVCKNIIDINLQYQHCNCSVNIFTSIFNIHLTSEPDL